MRAIIGGKRYNTEAKFTEAIADHESGNGRTDFRYYSEVLYRTNHGTWFLAGEGHGMSRYGTTHSDGSRGWGERIVPIDADEAMTWLEERGETEALETYFADQIEEA